MPELSYYGAYADFQTESKRDGAILMNADCIVGDRYEIEIANEGGKRTAWLKNKFGARVGYFDEKTCYELSLCEAKGWKLVGILSFVAFSENPEPGRYWGQAAVVSYPATEEELFDPFVDRVRKLISQGTRPQLDLGQQALNELRQSPDAWVPNGREDMPARDRGTVILKSREKFSEKMIEQGRKKNVGCYIVSWVFLLAVVTLVLVGLKSCGVF